MPKEDEEQPKLCLKNGSQVNARAAYSKWKLLDAHHRMHPQDFVPLLALAERKQLSDEQSTLLREKFPSELSSNGDLLPLVRDILENSYRNTPDGAVLVNPFQLSTEGEIELFDQIERRAMRIFAYLSGNHNKPPGQFRD